MGRLQGAFEASVQGPGGSCGGGHPEAGELTVGGGCGGRTGGDLKGGGVWLRAETTPPLLSCPQLQLFPLGPQPPSLLDSQVLPHPLPCLFPHTQSLPLHSCGLAPPLLWTQPPGGSLQTVQLPGCGAVHLPPVLGTQMSQGPHSLALAVRMRSKENTQGVPGNYTPNPCPTRCQRFSIPH